MQLWFAHKSPITLREQLVTQIILAILSDDLPPGHRLPRTRELARRFHLHPNTVSAGYRQLTKDRWVEFRKGSGVYVRNTKPQSAQSPDRVIDQLIADLLRQAREKEISLATIRSRLQHVLELHPPNHFLLIESDENLSAILTNEIQAAVNLPVKSTTSQNSQSPAIFENAIPVALAAKEKSAQQSLPPGAELLTLQVRSVPTSLNDWLPAPKGILIGVASRWPGFLKMARTVLTAAGLDPETLIFRDATKPNWQRGLKETAAVVCDVLTATKLPKGPYILKFPLLSEDSLKTLQRYEKFLTPPCPKS